MHLELLLPLFNIGLSLWVHAFLTSAHHFFRCCLGGGERRFGGFSFLDELTSGRYIFKRQLNPIVESHKICLWEEIIISHGGVISVIDRRASSTGMMHEYHVCTLCSRPPFFFFPGFLVFVYCLGTPSVHM